MSKRREAPPKPEELIKALEEKFNDFKSEIESRFEEQDKVYEEIRSSVEGLGARQREEASQLKESLEYQSSRLQESTESVR